MPETDPPPAAPKHPILRAMLRVPAMILVAIYFLIDDVVLAAIRPVIAWASELRVFARMGEALHRLPPYPTLILFLVPFAVLEPFKLGGLWLMATGRFGVGVTMLVIAHLASIVLVERLFHATRDKLLTIPWFATVHGWVSALYDWSLGHLKATTAWRTAAAMLATARGALRGAVIALRTRLGPIVAPLRREAMRALSGLLLRLKRRG